MTRAQTTMDFAAGISIFLVTVAFAFAFLPGVIAPFTQAGVADPVTANRIADDLASDQLAVDGTPYVLDADRVAAFFDAAGPPLADRVPVADYKSVNATLEEPGGGPIVVNGTTTTAGRAVPSGADTTVAWRVVSVDGRRLELVVRVW
ncbi:MAG: hypothetical protein ABEJ88_02210 [Halobacterium sp.]